MTRVRQRDSPSPERKYVAATYHIIFVDIVRYSRRKPKAQYDVVTALFSIIRKTLAAISRESDCKLLPTGDGVAICLQAKSESPGEVISFISKFAAAVERWNDSQIRKLSDEGRITYLVNLWTNKAAAFGFRMGVTQGTLLQYVDINGNDNLAGTAINDAARLLTLAEPNQVIFSETAMRSVRDLDATGVDFRRLLSRSIKGQNFEGWQLVGPKGISSSSIGPDEEEFHVNDGLDDLPHLWIRTNHSDPKIFWNAVDAEKRGGPGCLNRFSASISGASAGVRLPCGVAAG